MKQIKRHVKDDGSCTVFWAATRMKVSESTVRRMCLDGRLKHTKKDGVYSIDRESLTDLMKQNGMDITPDLFQAAQA
jgi:DeoR/GlpR family transcriptional regulator of sugar metabolism